MDLALDSRFCGPTLIQLGDIVNDENGIMRYDGVELVPRKHVVPEYGVVVKSPGDDWRGGISYVEGTLQTGLFLWVRVATSVYC